ncbi:hypothetical protein Bca52824_045568 [Brassica carinata]|uniref:thioglucosidase n=1 Tax=Brassica carinata TaxID=52824 RepID=A0A8X7RBB1_BRACI|nr:hypothetical protein Bca52824_045568 [Brassica carinata]
MRGEYLSLLVLIVLASNEVLAKKNSLTPKLRRSDFPEDFVFGSATSAYQIEGAAHEDGRGPSIRDTFSEKYPERINDGSNGSVADDSFGFENEDVALLHQIGFNAYRFSISWSRILPRNLKGGINQAGIDYYNNLINELLSKGIKPFVTIFHWDTPQSLEDAYGGYLGAKIVNDFRDYADICFKNFGDRVKHWMTLNEPLAVVQQGYVAGGLAPGRCSKFTNPNCTGGDGATEPYIVGHNSSLLTEPPKNSTEKNIRNLLLNVVQQESQKGKVGIALNAGWYLPYTESAEDRLAVARVMAFTIDYFLEPLVTGKYPVDMVNNVKGGRLPTFTAQQSKMLKGSYDFIGINYYSSAYAKDVPCSNENATLFSDPCASVTGEREGVPIGPKAASDWILIYPKGIRDLLLYAKYKFKDPVMYITENGNSQIHDLNIFIYLRMSFNFYPRHLEMVQDAISIGANVKGFFAWSLLDNFEWVNGYTVRFGLVYVDFKDGCKRYPKKSADWFKNFLNQKKNS